MGYTPSKKRGAKSTKSKKAGNAKKKTSKPSKSFEKKVQSVINKNAEDKTCFGSISNVYYNSGIDSQGDIKAVVPNMSQGTGDSQRIGDRVRAHHHVVKGCLQLASPQSVIAACRVAVRLMVVQPKAFSSLLSIQNNATTWLSYLLKRGSITTNFQGTLQDLWTPINNDAITTYYDKRFYLSTAYSATAAGYADLKDSIKFFTIRFRYKNKLLKYDSNIDGGLTPVDFNPVIIMGYTFLDGTAPSSISTYVSLSYDTVFTFQDL